MKMCLHLSLLPEALIASHLTQGQFGTRSGMEPSKTPEAFS